MSDGEGVGVGVGEGDGVGVGVGVGDGVGVGEGAGEGVGAGGGAVEPGYSPVRLCCGQRHDGAVCPDGQVMCCLCFGRFSTADLYVDAHKDRWDVCVRCAAAEAAEMRRRS